MDYDEGAHLYASEDSLKLKRQKSLAKDILHRKSVIKDLTKEIQEWQNNQDDATFQATPNSRDDDEQEVFRSNLHRYMCWVLRGSGFETFIMFTIATNAVFIAADTTTRSNTGSSMVFSIADLVFLTIYSLEFLLKVYCEPVGYWKSNYNRFDFIILGLSYFQFVQQISGSTGSNLTFVRVLRALRALRALRSISFVRALRVLVNALIKTMAEVFHVIAVLLLIMYVFAIMGYYLFGGESESDNSSSAWSTLGNAIYTLATYVTSDGWAAFQYDLDARGYKAARIYSVVFIFIGNFIFTNLFIGIIINNLDEAQEEDRVYQMVKKSALIKAKKEILLARQRQDFTTLDLEYPAASIQKILAQLAGKLRHDDFVPMTHLSCNTTWLQTYLETMLFQENTMYRTQQLHFELARVLAEMMEQRLAQNYDAPPPRSKIPPPAKGGGGGGGGAGGGGGGATAGRRMSRASSPLQQLSLQPAAAATAGLSELVVPPRSRAPSQQQNVIATTVGGGGAGAAAPAPVLARPPSDAAALPVAPPPAA